MQLKNHIIGFAKCLKDDLQDFKIDHLYEVLFVKDEDTFYLKNESGEDVSARRKHFEVMDEEKILKEKGDSFINTIYSGKDGFEEMDRIRQKAIFQAMTENASDLAIIKLKKGGHL